MVYFIFAAMNLTIVNIFDVLFTGISVALPLNLALHFLNRFDEVIPFFLVVLAFVPLYRTTSRLISNTLVLIPLLLDLIMTPSFLVRCLLVGVRCISSRLAVIVLLQRRSSSLWSLHSLNFFSIIIFFFHVPVFLRFSFGAHIVSSS